MEAIQAFSHSLDRPNSAHQRPVAAGPSPAGVGPAGARRGGKETLVADAVREGAAHFAGEDVAGVVTALLRDAR